MTQAITAAECIYSNSPDSLKTKMQKLIDDDYIVQGSITQGYKGFIVTMVKPAPVTEAEVLVEELKKELKILRIAHTKLTNKSEILENEISELTKKLSGAQ